MTKSYFTLFTGDPSDLSLRKVEEQVLIPKIMRERAKAEKCVDEVKGKILN
jgi:COX assembly mitochondrial protein 1